MIRFFSVFLFLFISFSDQFSAQATSPKQKEEAKSKVKAVYIFEIAKRTSQPDQNTLKNYNIGVLADESTYNALKVFEGKLIEENKILINYYSTPNEIESNTNLLFLGKYKGTNYLNQIKANTNTSKMLVIGENYSFYDVDFSFINVNKMLKFSVNKKSLNEKNINVGNLLSSLSFKTITDADEWNNSLDFLNKKLEDNTSEIVLDQNELNRIIQEIEAKEIAIDEINNEIRSKLTQIESLEKKQKNYDDSLSNKEAEITRKNNEIKNKYEEVSALENKQQKFLEQISQKTLEMNNLELEFQQKQKEIAVKSKTIQDQKKIQNLTNSILILVVLFLGFTAFTFFRVRKSRNIISSQKVDLEIKNQEINDSIQYAKGIQTAILPTFNTIHKHLKNSFVYYQPKDIVSGDFYWFEKVGNIILIAAADCTGHGVPGAMVSVICNSSLNKSVLEFNLTDPGLILDKTRELIIKEFEKSEEEIKDGMDIALCTIEQKNNHYELKFAGAHNPLWLVRNGVLEEYKGNRQPIGRSVRKDRFKTEIFQLKKGDSFYIFSDGYVDQFGGLKGKKYKSAPFKRYLLSINSKSMEDQKLLIAENFEKWKGNFDQLDDVCVIGVKVG